jgi:hypothetical protein
MRRAAIMLALGCCALVVLCSIRMAGTWEVQGHDLVLPGADAVQIERGAVDLHVTYHLPAGQTRYHVRQHLLQQGWVQIKMNNIDQSFWAFRRRMWFGLAREIAIVSVPSPRRRIVDIAVGRCFQLYNWTKCL